MKNVKMTLAALALTDVEKRKLPHADTGKFVEALIKRWSLFYLNRRPARR